MLCRPMMAASYTFGYQTIVSLCDALEIKTHTICNTASQQIAMLKK